MAQTKADAKTPEERNHSKRGNRIFVVVSWPKPDDQDCNRHGDADVGIPNESLHFLRQKTS